MKPKGTDRESNYTKFIKDFHNDEKIKDCKQIVVHKTESSELFTLPTTDRKCKLKKRKIKTKEKETNEKKKQEGNNNGKKEQGQRTQKSSRIMKNCIERGRKKKNINKHLNNVQHTDDEMSVTTYNTKESLKEKKSLKLMRKIKKFLVSNNIPIYTPDFIISIPFLISLSFFIFSFILLFKIQHIIECSVSYEDPKNKIKVQKNGETFEIYEEPLFLKINSYDCKGIDVKRKELTLDDNLYLYYELKNYYQNDRSYLKNSFEEAINRVDCTLNYRMKHEQVNMCSLRMLSIFNDSFSLYQNIEIKKTKPDSVESNETKKRIVNTHKSKNKEEIKKKDDSQFTQTFNFSNKELGNIKNNFILRNEIKLNKNVLSFEDYKTDNPEYEKENKKVLETLSFNFFNNTKVIEDQVLIWLLSSVSYNFKKPYAKIETKLLKFPFYIKIENRYRMNGFKGEKKIFITSVSAFGSRNYFLFYVFVLNAFIFLIIGIFFFTRNKQKNRIIGDASHFKWGSFN